MTGTTATNGVAETQRRSAGWQRLPAAYRFPDATPSLAEAKEYCRGLATSHYENFHVASWFLPRSLRPHFYSVYAYCRISDDLGDEVGDPTLSLELLEEWQAELDACYRGEARHPVFVALAETIQTCDIPKEPFAKLLAAFRQDQTTTRYESFDDLLGYCENSANPVGRLVLYLCGYRDAERQGLSDATCTALQLANFWQDVSLDRHKGRIYIPMESMRRFGVGEQELDGARASPRMKQLLRFEVERAREWFRRGMPLIAQVHQELALDIDLFSRGGMEILNAIERQDFDVLRRRPAISKPRKALLALRALAGKLI
ncbi:MAG: squalene synthase HpnC [Acidobacteriaceae bacterium]